MPNKGSKFACYTRPNGDEWHLDYLKTEQRLRIFVPEEKLIEAGVALRHRAGNWYEVTVAVGGERQAGPFRFVSIVLP